MNGMELWVDLLLWNWIGILSLVAVSGTLATGFYIIWMLYRKSHSNESLHADIRH